MDSDEAHCPDSAPAGCGAELGDQAAGCEPAPSDPGEASASTPAPDQAAGAPGQTPADEAAATPIRPATVREFERAMRGLGYSRREAETIRCRGFDALSQGSDHEEQPDAKLVEELKALLHKRAAALAVKD